MEFVTDLHNFSCLSPSTRMWIPQSFTTIFPPTKEGQTQSTRAKIGIWDQLPCFVQRVNPPSTWNHSKEGTRKKAKTSQFSKYKWQNPRTEVQASV
jgi:hypothetical protein